MQAQTTVQNQFDNSIMQGDCIDVMRNMPANSVDFILTDPPYLVNYRDRDGRTIQNDANADWLKPAMRETYRVLKQNRVAVMFYGDSVLCSTWRPKSTTAVRSEIDAQEKFISFVKVGVLTRVMSGRDTASLETGAGAKAANSSVDDLSLVIQSERRIRKPSWSRRGHKLSGAPL